MLLQNLRAKVGARLNGDKEAGFTLIELLVVMLILGILAAIALPAFFNQKDKAGDSKAKEYAHSAQVAIETCATDNNGQYTNCSIEKVREIEPSIPSTGVAVPTHTADTYVVETTGSKGWFKINRASDGSLTFTCEKGGEGGCSGTKGSAGTWGS